MFGQDGYKATMDYAAQAAGIKTPATRAKFMLQNRGPEKLGVLAPQLEWILSSKGGTARPSIQLTRSQLPTLRGMGLSYEYCQELRYMTPSAHVCHVAATAAGDLDYFVEGHDASWFEVPSLRTIQGLWTKHMGWDGNEDIYAEGRRRLRYKIDHYNYIPDGICKFVVMGTRRAFSARWQEYVELELARELRHYGGTSNIGYAQRFGVPCARTMAHEWLQMGQVPSLSPLVKLGKPMDYGATQHLQLERWRDVYEGTTTPLIALTDVLGVDAFLREFDPGLTRAYDGVRHDSGDPIVWGHKILAHYENEGVDPRTKIAVFSDNLTPEQVFRILDAFTGKFKLIIFGIGTDFTNDLGVPALKIVMKLVEYDGFPVVKIPDGSGKVSCTNPAFLDLMKKANGRA